MLSQIIYHLFIVDDRSSTVMILKQQDLFTIIILSRKTSIKNPTPIKEVNSHFTPDRISRTIIICYFHRCRNRTYFMRSIVDNILWTKDSP